MFEHCTERVLIAPKLLPNLSEADDWHPCAAYFGLDRVIMPLLENTNGFDFKEIHTRTPLSWTAGNGHETVIKLLLDQGVVFESKDIYDRTPLIWAAWNRCQTIVKPLFEQNAKLESKDSHGQTPNDYRGVLGTGAVP